MRKLGAFEYEHHLQARATGTSLACHFAPSAVSFLLYRQPRQATQDLHYITGSQTLVSAARTKSHSGFENEYVTRGRERGALAFGSGSKSL